MSKYCNKCIKFADNKCKVVWWRNIDDLNVSGNCGFFEKKHNSSKINIIVKRYLKKIKLLWKIKMKSGRI